MTDTNDKKPASEKFPVPIGFRSLLESLAREVLRAQPNDVIAFSSLYFSLLAQYDPADRAQLLAGNTELNAALKTKLLQEALDQSLITTRSPGWKYIEDYGGKEDNKTPESDENRNILIKNNCPQKPQPKEPLIEEGAEEEVENDVRRPPKELVKPTTLDIADKHQVEAAPSRLQKSEEGSDDAATMIQSAFRGYKVRKDPKYLTKRVSTGCFNASTSAASITDNTPPPSKGSRSHSVPGIFDENEAAEGDDDTAASVIQAGVRGYLTRKQVDRKRENMTNAATKIQSAYRGFETRKRLDTNDGIIITGKSGCNDEDKKEENDSSMREGKEAIEDDRDAEPQAQLNADSAAVMIQKEVRGFLVRKDQEKQKDAATKIQAAYRGFSVRRDTFDES